MKNLNSNNNSRDGRKKTSVKDNRSIQKKKNGIKYKGIDVQISKEERERADLVSDLLCL